MNSLKEINDFLKPHGLEMVKSNEGYFYFISDKYSTVPESIYTNSVKHITKNDLDYAIVHWHGVEIVKELSDVVIKIHSLRKNRS